VGNVKALRRSDTGKGTQDIDSADTLDAPDLNVSTTFVAPAGSAFPGTTVPGQWFWRTDTKTLYRRNSTNLAWEAVSCGIKAGVTSGSSFVSSPKQAPVTFVTPYPDTNYAVSYMISTGSGADAAFIATIENKLATGFSINLHTDIITDVIDVEWTTTPLGNS